MVKLLLELVELILHTSQMRIFGYGKSGRDPKLVVDACKFLELAVLLRLQDFNLYCLFVLSILQLMESSSGTNGYF